MKLSAFALWAVLLSAFAGGAAANEEFIPYYKNTEVVRDASGRRIGELIQDPRYAGRAAVIIALDKRKLSLFVDDIGIRGRHGVAFKDPNCAGVPYVKYPFRVPEDAEFVAGKLYVATGNRDSESIIARSEMESDGTCQRITPTKLKFRTTAEARPFPISSPLDVAVEQRLVTTPPEIEVPLLALLRGALRSQGFRQ